MAVTKTRRQIAAEETQRAIVEAAHALFLERGYHATSIGVVAAQAGVAVQTIYNSVGSKRDLLSRVLDYAAAGERAPTPVPTFMRDQTEREPDPRRIIDQLVERGALREGLTPDDAAAVIFTLGHPDQYRFLVKEQGWPADRWAEWVRSALVAALLTPR